ncbi:Flp pilus assembly protein CpaB [Litorisediminicola beolgyonensis]|uniref:Flp pilus assembly protein CpaB n=1 Tax=Litorisediminicola beolgyonensis TaxID=1173614 RepID=A0ABW3ZHK4_9RHOB
MRLVFGLVLIAGLGLAAVAVYMAKNYIGAYETALQEERERQNEIVKTRDIYIATRAIAFGETLTTEDVRLAKWTVDALPETYFDEENPFFVPEEGPRVALRPIELNEAFSSVKVSEPGGDAGLTSRLEKGQRAFALRVDVASGVSGFLRPGDKVDIYWTGNIRMSDPNLPQGDVTKLIQAGITLIAIDQTAEVDAPESAMIARTVTVAVTPQQVAALAQAQSTGSLSLSLMAHNDETVAEAIEVDQRTLLGIKKEEKKSPTKSLQVCTIRTRRGNDVVEIPIPCTN